MKPRGVAFLIIFLLVLVLTTSSYFAEQPPISILASPLDPNDPWSLLWMRTQNDNFSSVASGTGGIYVAGTTQDLEDMKQNILLLKYSVEGELLWNQTWKAPYDEAASALTTSMDAVYLAGKTTSGLFGTNGLLVKLDFNGNQLWNVSFGNSPSEWFTSIGIGIDGVYVGGIIQRSQLDDADALIAKFDFDGNEVWSELWDLAPVDRGYGIAVGSDGVYLVGDYGNLWDGSDNNAFLAKFSPTGILIWNVTWGGALKDLARAVNVYNDSVYVTGSTQSFSSSSTGELFLRKYNSTSILLWEEIKNTGLNHEGIDLFATEDNIYVGSEYEDPDAGYRVNLLNYNVTGALNWERSWGGTGSCQPFGFASGNNGHYFSGITSGWLTESTNGFLVKIGNNGETSPGPVELLEPTILNPYGSLILSWTNALDADGTIDIYEIQMDTTPFFHIPDRTWNVNTTSLLLSNHPPGTYNFRVRARDNNNLFSPWSNIITVTITLVPPTLFNPWLAPLILTLGILIIMALILWIFIRRWRVQ